jgi:hypothetical protein
LVCQPLLPFAPHVFTSRRWPIGTSSQIDDPGVWEDVAQAVGLDRSCVLRTRQVHGASVVVHREGERLVPRPEGDVLMSDDSHVVAAIQTADCVPLLIADTRSGAVAAAHAGWRGLAERVPLVAVAAMEEQLGSRASKLIAAVGPSIGACCYEVGDDVRQRFAAAGFSDWELGRWFLHEPRPSAANPSMPNLGAARADRRWFLDLWTAARDQLRLAGVREDRIFVAELCTASHPAAFCSYRRDGARAGRMAAAIRKLAERS